MRVTVAFADAALAIAIVQYEPAWWDRLLFGAREGVDFAVATPDLGGGRCWIWDSTGRRVEHRLVEAIEEERAELELAQAIAEQGRARTGRGRGQR